MTPFVEILISDYGVDPAAFQEVLQGDPALNRLLENRRARMSAAHQLLVRFFKKVSACNCARRVLLELRKEHEAWLLLWKPVADLLSDASFVPLKSWEQLKAENDFASSATLSAYEQELMSEIDSLSEMVLTEDDRSAGLSSSSDAIVAGPEAFACGEEAAYHSPQVPRDAIELSGSVVKWLEHVDGRYRCSRDGSRSWQRGAAAML